MEPNQDDWNDLNFQIGSGITVVDTFEIEISPLLLN
mgnify:FL=1